MPSDEFTLDFFLMPTDKVQLAYYFSKQAQTAWAFFYRNQPPGDPHRLLTFYANVHLYSPINSFTSGIPSHVAIICKSASYIKHFINGDLVSERLAGVPAITTNTNDLIIGAFSLVSGFGQATLDHLSFWNRALAPAQIKQHSERRY
ncbi:hypothetical protein ES703_124092 [subsurface metagenome]